MNKIPFNVPYMTGMETAYIEQAHNNLHLSGDGPFTKKCHTWLEKKTGTKKAFLSTSCTSALEMACILSGIGPGDEVIMPSFTFVTSANAFVRHGAVPVFVDIRSDTLNIDENKIEEAITKKTKAIVPVHYAGVSCEMDTIMAIAKRHNLKVIEDAAQGICADYKNKALGTMGDFGAISFHESKNIICGEGGALLVNDEKFVGKAEIAWEKGTDRRSFYRGEVDKYTWQDVGSSFLLGDVLAAFLYAQLEEADHITKNRLLIFNQYMNRLGKEAEGYGITLPTVPAQIKPNGHIFYLLMPETNNREKFMKQLAEFSVESTFHYVPLHSSPGGRKYGKTPAGTLPVTDSVANKIVRLPLWTGIENRVDELIEKVILAMKNVFV